MNEVIKLLRSAPPHCLEKLELTETDIKGSSSMPFRDEFMHVLLRCTCGSRKFYVFACKHEEMVGFFKKRPIVSFSGPVKLACEQCRDSYSIFDPEKDGWNGQIAVLNGWRDEDQTELSLEACFSEPGEVAVCYSYQGIDNYHDLVDDEEISNPQDFFDTFEVTVSFDGRKTFKAVTSHECA